MENTTLLLIDFQNDYFPSFKDAKWKLDNTEDAANNALLLLKEFREKNMNIVHVKHEFLSDDAPFFAQNTEGAKIYKNLLPLNSEKVILKHKVNSFIDTNLKEVLDEMDTKNLVIVGAMSHMCIDAVVRASSDYGYNCFVAHDSCATLPLEFDGVKVPSKMVHASFMSALQFAYAKVQSTKKILELI
ncbi:cysteine hydrolase family protein [Poseidonibacter lekithochrous]|uniref:cysteine hydrolase family protein n=1 Tax=Poseidonibacter lekithochrous TaxID=1904463 RepID=UPI000D3B0059|nr:cysteine hydrolase family protein [Poseidonibacter lekithochrous]